MAAGKRQCRRAPTRSRRGRDRLGCRQPPNRGTTVPCPPTPSPSPPTMPASSSRTCSRRRSARAASRCSTSAPTTATPSTIPTWPATLAAALGDGRAQRGVLVCGTGIGISIAANRHRHVRAALCHDVTTATLARQHNDANVLVLGARVVGAIVAFDCLAAFLDTRVRGRAASAAGRQAGLTRPCRKSGRLL